jgi:pyridoxine 4-dehydrogenase
MQAGKNITGVPVVKRAPIILLIPGTSSVDRLRENLAAKALDLPVSALMKLGAIAGGNA